MGTTRVSVTVRNIAEPDRSWTGLFVVDTGAMNSVITKEVLEAIGATHVKQRTYRLADGQLQTFNLSSAVLEFMDSVTASDVIIGEPDTEPTLGRISMLSAGVEVDSEDGTLRKLSAIPLPTLIAAR